MNALAPIQIIRHVYSPPVAGSEPVEILCQVIRSGHDCFAWIDGIDHNTPVLDLLGPDWAERRVGSAATLFETHSDLLLPAMEAYLEQEGDVPSPTMVVRIIDMMKREGVSAAAAAQACLAWGRMFQDLDGLLRHAVRRSLYSSSAAGTAAATAARVGSLTEVLGRAL